MVFTKSKFRNVFWKKDRINWITSTWYSLCLHLHFAKPICELQTYRISQTLSTCQSFYEISALIRGKIRIYKRLVQFTCLWNSICLQFNDRFRKLQMRAKRIHVDVIQVIRSFFIIRFETCFFLKPSMAWCLEKFETCLLPENNNSLLFCLAFCWCAGGCACSV